MIKHENLSQTLTWNITHIRSRNQYSLKLLFASILEKLGNLKPAIERNAGTTTLPAQVVSVILADDDPDDRELFAEVIAAIDPRIRVTTFCDCNSLLDALRDQELALPDVVFLDLNMPGKNGKQCLAEIKNNNRFQKLPVVIYSTSTLARDIQETQKMGADLFLRKPTSFNDTLTLIKRVFALDFEQIKTPGYAYDFVLTAHNKYY